jgi:hypothetical protein
MDDNRQNICFHTREHFGHDQNPKALKCPNNQEKETDTDGTENVPNISTSPFIHTIKQ